MVVCSYKDRNRMDNYLNTIHACDTIYLQICIIKAVLLKQGVQILFSLFDMSFCVNWEPRDYQNVLYRTEKIMYLKLVNLCWKFLSAIHLWCSDESKLHSCNKSMVL